MKTLIGCLAFFITLVLSCPVGLSQDALKADNKGTKNVLILFSVANGSKLATSVYEQIYDVLSRDVDGIVQTHIEYMDMDKQYSDTYLEHLSEHYNKKYANIDLDLIIPVNWPAAALLAQEKVGAFKGVPRVVSLLDISRINSLAGLHMPGVALDHGLEDTINVMLKIHPDARQIFIVIGASKVSQTIIKKQRSKLEAYSSQVKMTFLIGLTIEDLIATVSKLPPDALVLCHLFLKDGKGQMFLLEKAIALISREASVPVYTSLEGLFGHGAVGGVLNPVLAPVRKAGEMGAQILNGMDPESMPLEVFKEKEPPVFDWRQLKRWGIKEERLPEGSKVMYKEYTLWEKNKGKVIAAVSLCVAEMFLILFLVFQRKRRFKAESLSMRLTAAIENTTEDIAITDTDGKITYVNPGFERVTGYTFKEIKGRMLRMLTEHPLNQTPCSQIWQTLRSGQSWTGRISNETKSGRIIYQDANISPIAGSDGHPVGFVSVRRDVTEKLALEKQIRQSQKMEAIGTLAGGIAHDFNNILTPIIVHCELAQEYAEPKSPLMGHLEPILLAGMRARELVRQILAFSRKSEEEQKPVALAPILKESVKLLRSALPTTITITLQIDEGAHIVLADPVQVYQVVMNLCTNAGQAMTDFGGKLRLHLATELLDENKAAFQPGLEPGFFSRITVTDTGPGIPPEVLPHIFEPFYTTKQRGEGTGMGLSIVHGIVKSAGGVIEVHSKQNRGTTFTVYLPQCEVVPKSAAVFQPDIPRGKEHILLVDDDEATLDTIQKMLEWLGYHVQAHTHPREALNSFIVEPGRVDLLITDYTMPVLNGLELASVALKIKPDLPIILCTGYSEIWTRDELLSAGIREMIVKPVIMHDIAGLIRKVLYSDDSNIDHRRRQDDLRIAGEPG